MASDEILVASVFQLDGGSTVTQEAPQHMGFASPKPISRIVRAPWYVREVKSYAPSKFQPPTTLGDHQNVEKTIREKIYFFEFRKSVLGNFSWILKGIDNFKRQNQFPREILLQIHLF